MNTTERIIHAADGLWLQRISRLSMAAIMPVLGFVGWLVMDYIQTHVEKPIAKFEHRIDALEGSDRSTQIINSIQDGFIRSNKEAVGEIKGQVKEFGDKIDKVGNALNRIEGALEERNRKLGSVEQ